MVQPTSTVFRFRVFLLWQGLLVLLVGCALGSVPLWMLFQNSALREWWPMEGIGKIVLILAILGTFMLSKRWFTIQADFTIGIDSLEIILEKPRRFFQPSDQLIFWNELAEWQVEAAHFTVHTIAPPTFKIKLTDGKKIRLLIASDGPAYTSFLQHLEAKLKEVNQRNAAIGHIRREPEFSQSTAGFWFMVGTAALLLGGGTYLFFLPMDGNTDLVGNWEMYSISLFSGSFALILGFLMRCQFKKRTRNEQ